MHCRQAPWCNLPTLAVLRGAVPLGVCLRNVPVCSVPTTVVMVVAAAGGGGGAGRGTQALRQHAIAPWTRHGGSAFDPLLSAWYGSRTCV
jgi:hypothetical protein